MRELPPDDDHLAGLVGSEIRSQHASGGYYRIDRSIGEGGMSIAFLAMRIAAEGIAPVVVKLPRPSLLQHGTRADLTIRKEGVALQRLNERVPPTPFVVRLIEVGTLTVMLGDTPTEMPWLSIEYVHGGPEGTTLEQRVGATVRRTGSAFDPSRAALAIECMCRGLRAVHEVGIFHRDLTPRNVLCCGFGDSEIFKIADFGIARPVGMSGTFGSSVMILGTPGYAAPEQLSYDARQMGTWSDVFSLGCLVFYVLAGESLFPARNVSQALTAPYRPERRSILDATALSEELRSRPAVCKAIDEVLASMTAGDPAKRLANSDLLLTLVVPLLRAEGSQRSLPNDRIRRLVVTEPPPEASRRWVWATKHLGGDERTIRNAAWDGDGRCLAATVRGLEFWNGTGWSMASTEGVLDDAAVHMVHRMSAGRWLIGGEGPALFVLTTSGATAVVRGPDAGVTWRHACGEIRDLAVLVGYMADQEPRVYTLCGGRWLKPMSLAGVAEVTSLARLDDERWLLAGKATGGGGWLAIARPTEWSVEARVVPSVDAFLACAGDADRRAGLFAGTKGHLIALDSNGIHETGIEGAGDLWATAIDATGAQWAAGMGSIWTRATRGAAWETVWHDPTPAAPWISLLAHVGIVRALTVDGAVLEGRFEATSGTGES